MQTAKMRKAMTRWAAAAATMMLLAGPASAQTAPAEASPLTPQADLLLRAIDIPLTPETIARAGLTPAEAMAVVADGEASRYARVRAVGALGVFGTLEARRVIERLAVADPDEQVRVQAVISLARVFGPDDRAAVAGFLVDRLELATPAVDRVVLKELERLYHPAR